MKLPRLIVRPIALAVFGATLAASSLSALAFQQPGKIVAGSDMTFFPYTTLFRSLGGIDADEQRARNFCVVGA